ncbi:MAG: M16 family metallopeptidase [Pseudobdellovibrionaceae bacterium]
MKKSSLLPLILFFLGVSLACSSMNSKSSEKQFELRPVQEKTLPNGMRVLYIPDTSLPRVGYQLMIRSGAARDPQGSEGLAAMTVALLEQGSKKRKALEIADDFAQLGSSFNESSAMDYMMLTTSGLSQFKDQLLDLYADVILNPAFAPAEVERKRSQVLAELMQLPDRPSEYAALLLDREVFGQHPYGHPVLGTIKSVKGIQRDQIAKFYSAQFQPANAILAITGNFDEAFKERVEKTFSPWQGKALENFEMPIPKAHVQRSFKLYTKPGLQQTQIRIGQLGIARNDPDFLKLRMGNVILGGAFASRLNQKVRDDLGLTYSISSQFDAKLRTGSFEISTFARNDKVAEAIKASLQVVDEFQAKGITEKELNAAKALLIGQFPAAIETTDRLAFNLLILRAYGVSDSYLTDFFQNVNSITVADINEAIKKHVHPEWMKVVLFADEKAVQKQLVDFGNFQVEQIP